MGEYSSGLSSALRELAAANHDAPRPADPASSEPQDATARPREPHAIASARPPRPAARARPHQPEHKIMAIPVMILLATALLVPGVWSVLVLTGVWQSERHDARAMALAMLACWPIALCVYAGAVFFYVQMRKARGRASRGSGQTTDA
jgi:hypothetical protein